MAAFVKWFNYAVELCRIDPEIYPMMLVGFTSMSWGSYLLLRKAGQVKLENRIPPSDFD